MHSTIYFAYGSNLFREQMKTRCPMAEPVRAAKLDGYRLAFVGFSKQWGGGVASVKPCGKSSVQGALYKLTESDEMALDRYEGVPGGFYVKEFMKIDGENALVYVCTHNLEKPPSRLYLETIRKGYFDWGLSLADMQFVKTMEDLEP